jgi:hypothetical protein
MQTWQKLLISVIVAVSLTFLLLEWWIGSMIQSYSGL